MAWYDDLLSWGQNNPGLVTAGATLAGGLLGSANGSQQAGTTTQTTAPWAPQQPYLQDLFQRARTQSQQPGVSPLMNTALQGMQSANASPLTGQAQSTISNTLNTNPSNYFGIGQRTTLAPNSYLQGGMDNPYLQQSIDSASQDAMRNLNPAFAQAQRASGSFGNAGLAEQFARTSASTLGNIANTARMGQFNTNMGMENQNNQAQAGFNQQGIQNDIGQYNQGQSVLNNAAFNTPSFTASNQNNAGSLFNAASLANQAQWQPLQNYGALVSGGNGSTSTSPYYTNPVSGALGGGLLGSQIAGNIFGSK